MNNTNEIPLKQIIDTAISKIGEVVDVNTVIGDPITIQGDVTIIPFSKVAVGFASGGTEFGGKHPSPNGKAYFAGGNGAGVTMSPLGFIVVEQGKARVVELGNTATYNAPTDPVNRVLDGINGVVDKAPDILAKIMALFNGNTENTDEELVAVEVEETVAE
ncbi:MAG: sporulation protein YtfJ [Clostridia bacterium]|nr:sporulation protein YtfJ [Clostridia bacterium]